METETVTADDSDAAEDPMTAGEQQDPVITDAELVLDNLLDVVKKQADEILAAARADAESEAAAARTRAAAERDEVLTSAHREADDLVRAARAAAADQHVSLLAVVEASIAELTQLAEYRGRLEALAQQLRGTADTVNGYLEVNPETLQMLAGELGDEACREVIDTFVGELTGQLEALADAVETDDVKSKHVSRILHNLSSGCATVGAPDMAALCNQVSAETLGENLEQLIRRGRSVRAEVLRVRDSELTDGDASSFGEDPS